MKKLLAICIGAVSIWAGVARAAEAPSDLEVVRSRYVPSNLVAVERPDDRKVRDRVFVHGDCSWVAPVALNAGWKKNELQRLIEIIKRESGCCPRRIGGSVVDKECNQIKMATWKHPSDSGLLQINGVHWKEDHPQYHGLVCKEMGICSQEPLLDPLTNLVAGRLLFSVAGWSPWQPVRAGS
jgi:hypothetical protein